MVDISGRRETTATGPAWQVREAARQRLLEKIQRDITEHEGLTSRAEYYRTLFHTLDKYLADGDVNDGRPIVRINKRQPMYGVFAKMVDDIVRFQRSGKEGKALLAKLLEWLTGEIARPHHSALREQEIRQPKLIYGVEHTTDEVPFE